jgi:hypothetical protein
VLEQEGYTWIGNPVRWALDATTLEGLADHEMLHEREVLQHNTAVFILANNRMD